MPGAESGGFVKQLLDYTRDTRLISLQTDYFVHSQVEICHTVL